MPDHKGKCYEQSSTCRCNCHKADLSKAQAKVALEEIINGITQSLKEGDAVQLVGFGTFKVNHRAGRTGRNPQTGKDPDCSRQCAVLRGWQGAERRRQIRSSCNQMKPGLCRVFLFHLRQNLFQIHSEYGMRCSEVDMEQKNAIRQVAVPWAPSRQLLPAWSWPNCIRISGRHLTVMLGRARSIDLPPLPLCRVSFRHIFAVRVMEDCDLAEGVTATSSRSRSSSSPRPVSPAGSIRNPMDCTWMKICSTTASRPGITAPMC